MIVKGVEVMNEKLTDVLIDILFGGIKKKIKNVMENHKWKELFVNTGELLITIPDSKDSFEQDLFAVFSNENLEEMAKKLKDKKGYEFPKLLHKELYELMMEYEIPIIEAETYIYHFMQVIIKYIEETDSNKYLEMFLGELRENINSQFGSIVSKLELIINQIASLKEEEILCYSISDIDIEIRKESKYKGLSLDFFKVDDEQFELRFQNVIHEERIYVVGKSREETVYRILNELREKNSDRVTLIIKSEDDWKKLQKVDISGKILIPFFYSNKILAIPNNTNIFIYGEDEPCYSNEKIVLRRRTRKNIINSLEAAGIKYSEAYQIVDNTHGLYVPLKKKIFNGAMYDTPDWVIEHSDVVMAALLCGKWTESSGDKLVFEELSGKKYTECEKELKKYLYRENPYIVINQGYHASNMQLASVEDAWEELDIFITDELWEKYINLLYVILIESEPIFEYSFEKHFEASIYAKKPEWSPILKQGMLRTLIMRAYYKGHEEKQKQIDNIVTKILDTINTKERWAYISQYLSDLCEASPESFLSKIENELLHPQGLLELFKKNDGNIFTARNYYVNVLWAVEQLIQQKKYVFRALEWLWKLDAYNIKYSISNTPRAILEVVFCAWTNESSLSVDTKIEQAEKAINNYRNAWDIIESELPKGRNTICSTLSKPKYRKIDESDTLNMNDINTTYIKYLKMCVTTANDNEERWIKIISHLSSYDTTIREEVFEKLLSKCNQMIDNKKVKIKDKIRNEIFRHRYFCTADWSMPEDEVCKYEDVMKKIELNNMVFDYLYIFSPSYEFPLLHPIPYTHDESSDVHEENNIKREEEIKSKLEEFNRNGYSIEELIQLSVNKKQCRLGEIFAKFYNEGRFDEKIFNLLLKYDEEGRCVFDYIKYLYETVDLNKILKRIKSLSNNTNLLVNIISLEKVENIENAWIFKEDEDIKKEYWSRNRGIFISEKAPHEVWILALDECKRYGIINSYLELLYDIHTKLSLEELYDATLAIKQFNERNELGSMGSYYLEEIFKVLQEAFIIDDEKCVELAYLEWMLRNVFEWEQMKCLQKVIKEDPTFYADLVKIIYKSDNSSEDDEKKQIANRVYSGFYKAQFCPGEKNGKIIYEDLKEWIDKFKELLKKQGQERLFGNLIGKLLSYSPIGEDGFYPCESVRKIIEEYYSESLKQSFVVAEQNKRGVYTFDAGKSELLYHYKYQKNADEIRKNYPKTAKIYDDLSSIYMRESEIERRRAEDEL